MNQQRIKQINELTQQMQVVFHDSTLLHQALVHTSFANESKSNQVQHNQRLEFLGDAVLDLVIGEYLFRQFPHLPEGELTKARARIVCEPTLANCAAKIDLGSYLLLGKGEAATGGRRRVSILADAFEAVIGALYIDSGYEAASRFILHYLEDELSLVRQGEYVNDYKTLLQEIVQRDGEQRIVYEVLEESGPDHDKSFLVALYLNNKQWGTGRGKSKKEAEQCAAKQAIDKLNNEK